MRWCPFQSAVGLLVISFRTGHYRKIAIALTALESARHRVVGRQSGNYRTGNVFLCCFRSMPELGLFRSRDSSLPFDPHTRKQAEGA